MYYKHNLHTTLTLGSHPIGYTNKVKGRYATDMYKANLKCNAPRQTSMLQVMRVRPIKLLIEELNILETEISVFINLDTTKRLFIILSILIDISSRAYAHHVPARFYSPYLITTMSHPYLRMAASRSNKRC